MKKFLKSRGGFTLIELLVVIAIIGILAAVVVLAINPVAIMQKGRDSSRKSDLATLSKAIDIYMTQGATAVPGGANVNQESFFGADPNDDCCSGSATTCTGPQNSATGGWLVPWAASCGSDLSPYIGKVPQDPNNTATLRYHYDTNTTSDRYCLEADMEHVDSGTSYKVGTDLTGCTLF